MRSEVLMGINVRHDYYHVSGSVIQSPSTV